MELFTTTTDVTLESQECWKCAGVYALTKRFAHQARKDGRTWHCPYCQASTWYGEGENARLKRKLRDAEDRRACEVAAHDQTKACLRATKGAKTKLRKQIANGLCPCCGQYFKDLHKHIETEHPHFGHGD